MSIPSCYRAADLTGIRFSKLLVLDHAGTYGSGKHLWLCLCDCGSKRIVMGGNLTRGLTKSCGCYSRMLASESCKAKTTHGLGHKPMGAVWRSMMSRCNNPKNEYYKFYGGRGICVCQYLSSDPRAIELTIGSRPNGLTIDRIDNNKHYSCGSCQQCLSNNWALNIRWLSTFFQARNRSNNRMVTYNGKTQCVYDWAKELGLKAGTIYYRLNNGVMPPELFSKI